MRRFSRLISMPFKISFKNRHHATVTGSFGSVAKAGLPDGLFSNPKSQFW
jgi:hypothetical protein